MRLWSQEYFVKQKIKVSLYYIPIYNNNIILIQIILFY